jgi:hypothetical protein
MRKYVAPMCDFIMPNACLTVSPLAYGSRIRIDTLLHGIEQMLVLPSRDAPLRPGRALRFDGALETGGRPVTLQNLAGLLFGVAIGQ